MANWHVPKHLHTRLAPTPSGYLHAGNGLSFLITWAFARATGGRILLRIDDLDSERYRPAYVKDIFQTIEWLGIDYDHGPSDVTDFEQNWSQHTRLVLYQEALKKLQEKQFVFACDCSRKKWQAQSTNGKYPDICRERNLPLIQDEVAWRLQPTWTSPVLLDTKGCSTVIEDATLPDAFIVRQKNNRPAYQLASVVDDQHFGINFIVRGQDLYSSTIAQLVLAPKIDAEQFKETVFHHHSLLLNADGQKLSKSKGASALVNWRENGQLPTHLIQQAAQMLALPNPLPNTAQELARTLSESIQ